MPTADELLAGVQTVDKTLVISNDFRTISIPSSVPNLGVEYDDDVLQLDFKMPRYVSNTDLSTFAIRINYINSKGESDAYTVSDSNKKVYNQYITFSWLVGPTATRYKGNTKFNVCAKTLKQVYDDEGKPTDEYVVDREFNTTIATLPVLEGLEVDESVVSEYSDILEQWRYQLFGATDSAIFEINDYANSKVEWVHYEIDQKRDQVLASIPPDYTTAVNMVDNADRTKSDAIISTANGEAITVSDSSDDYIRGLRVFGKTTQVTTTGKNLFNPYATQNNSFGNAVVDNNGAKITVTGTYYVSWPLVLKAGVTYYIDFKTVDNATNRAVRFEYPDKEITETITNPASFTPTKDTVSVYLYSGLDTEGTVIYENVQITEGTSATTYEPYSGGYDSPSPEWPQELKNIESPTVYVYSKNVLGANATRTATLSNGVTFKTVEGSSEYVFNGTATGQNGSGLLIQRATIPPGTYTCSVRGLSSGTSGTDYINLKLYNASKYLFTGLGNKATRTFTIEEPTEVLVEIVVCAGSVYNNAVVTVQLETNTIATDYEPCVGQQQISIVRSIPGIPVSQNGNYTDDNGQQWVCDEVDFERGEYIQRIKHFVLTGSEQIVNVSGDYAIPLNTSDYAYDYSDRAQCLCNYYPGVSRHDITELIKVSGSLGVSANLNYIRFADTLHYPTADVDAFRQFIYDKSDAGDPVVVSYILAKPRYTNLTAEEIEWFRFAHTNFPNTTILNDVGAGMELKYNADTKTYLDNCFRPTDEQVRGAVDKWLEDNIDDIPKPNVSAQIVNGVLILK